MTDDTTSKASPDRDDAQDAALLGELRRLSVMTDPVPAGAVAAARSAFAWRTMDAELAELTADTSVDALAVGVRGTSGPAILTFDAPGLTVEVEVVEVAGDGAGRRLIGQLVPPASGTVEVRHKAGVATVEVDEAGRFSADGLVAGPVSLRCSAGATVVETDWFLA